MRRLTFRTALGLLMCAAGIILATAWDARPAQPAPPAVERLVIGPLPLGDWFLRATADASPGGGFDLGTGPDKKVAAADLNAARLFILELRDVSDPRRPRFVESKEFPALVVADRATHRWGEGGKTCALSLGKMRVLVNSTTTAGPGPERRTVRAGVELELSGTRALVRVESTFALSERLTYDATGRLVEPGRD